MDIAKAKNVIYNWLGLFATVLYAFFMTPFIVHRLGDTQYGIWNIIMSCVGYMAILDFGIETAVNRYVSKYKGLKDVVSLNKVYSNAIAVYFAIGTITMTLGLLMTCYLDKIFNIPSDEIQLAHHVMLLMVVYSAVQFPLKVLGGIIYAYQRFDILNSISVLGLGLQGFLIWYFIGEGGDLITFAIIVVLMGLIKYFLQYLFAHRIVPQLKFSFTWLSLSMLTILLKYGGITFLAIIASYIIFRTDNIVIGAILTPEAVTIYSIGFMMSDYVSQLIGRMCNTLTPIFSEHEARKESDDLRSLLITSSRFSILIGIPLGLIVVVIGKQFIVLWMGKEYESAYTIMVILMCARMVGFPAAPMYSMLYGIGKHHIVLYVGIFEAVANLILSLIFVKLYGITGVALGTLLPMIIANCVFPLVACKEIKLVFSDWIKRAVLNPILFCICFFCAITCCTKFFSFGHGWANLFFQLFAVGVIYFFLLYFIGLNRAEKNIFLRRIVKVQ